jgi:hypothetical protein
VALTQSELLEEIGPQNIFGDIDQALNAARARLGLAPEETSSRQAPV